MISDENLLAWEEDPWLLESPVTGKIDSFKTIQELCTQLKRWRKLGREISKKAETADHLEQDGDLFIRLKQLLAQSQGTQTEGEKIVFPLEGKPQTFKITGYDKEKKD